MVLLVAYSLGLGVPFLATGLAFGRLTEVLARVRRRLCLVNAVAGVALVVFGVLLLTDNLHWVSSAAADVLRALGLEPPDGELRPSRGRPRRRPGRPAWILGGGPPVAWAAAHGPRRPPPCRCRSDRAIPSPGRRRSRRRPGRGRRSRGARTGRARRACCGSAPACCPSPAARRSSSATTSGASAPAVRRQVRDARPRRRPLRRLDRGRERPFRACAPRAAASAASTPPSTGWASSGDSGARPVGRLSAGQRRRVALAVLVARRPELWLLDEPHAGLDADARRLLGEIVTEAVAERRHRGARLPRARGVAAPRRPGGVPGRGRVSWRTRARAPGRPGCRRRAADRLPGVAGDAHVA